MTPRDFGQRVAAELLKTAAGPTTGTTQPSSSFFSEWMNAPKGTGTLDYMDKWYNPWTKNTDGLTKGEGTLMNAGRAAMGVGAGAAALAGGAAAGPALATAARTAAPAVGKGIGQAYKAYSTVTSPVGQHAAKLAPQAMKPFTNSLVKSVGTGLTATTAYDTYNTAADATAESAQSLARQTGINDPKILNEVGSRARGQMLPMAYRALAPSWMGGDSSPIGQTLRKDIGTMAYHNIRPAMLNPSQSAVNMTPTQRAITGAFGNPVGALTSAVLPARPSAQQMWNNIPADRRQQMGQNIMNATTDPNSANSPLSKSMQHIFQPAVQQHQQNFANMGNNVMSSLNMGGF